MANFISVDGNLASDPRVSEFKDRNGKNKSVAGFRIANKEGTGDYTRTTWLDVVCFGGWAANLKAKKGDKVLIGGKIQEKEYTDKEGNKKKTMQIVAEYVYQVDTSSMKKQPSQTPSLQDISASLDNSSSFSAEDIPF